MPWRLPAVFSLTWLTLGCAAPISYHTGGAAWVSHVHAGGRWDLYATGEHFPEYVASVRVSESLGFTRDRAGRLVGVAGHDHIFLTDRNYSWRAITYDAAQPAGTDFNSLIFGKILTPIFTVAYYFGPMWNHLKIKWP